MKKIERLIRLANRLDSLGMTKAADKIDDMTKIAQLPDLKSIVYIMSIAISSEVVLAYKLKKYHWNITGVFFNDLHAFFEREYEKIEDSIDAIAERIRALGHPAPGTLSEFLALSWLKENPQKNLKSEEMVADLFKNYQTLASMYRSIVPWVESSDPVTSNFFADLGFKRDKTMWQLRALLGKL